MSVLVNISWKTDTAHFHIYIYILYIHGYSVMWKTTIRKVKKVKKHYNRYIYATYERIFEAGTKENLQTYQRKFNYGRKPVLINLLTLFNYWSIRWRSLLLPLKSACSHDWWKFMTTFSYLIWKISSRKNEVSVGSFLLNRLSVW